MRYKIRYTARKLRPYALDADKIAGTRTSLVHIEQDVRMDDFGDFGRLAHHKSVHAFRNQKRLERDLEKRSARHRMKTELRRRI